MGLILLDYADLVLPGAGAELMGRTTRYTQQHARQVQILPGEITGLYEVLKVETRKIDVHCSISELSRLSYLYGLNATQ